MAVTESAIGRRSRREWSDPTGDMAIARVDAQLAKTRKQVEIGTQPSRVIAKSPEAAVGTIVFMVKPEQVMEQPQEHELLPPGYRPFPSKDDLFRHLETIAGQNAAELTRLQLELSRIKANRGGKKHWSEDDFAKLERYQGLLAIQSQLNSDIQLRKDRLREEYLLSRT
ncbi:hypothetical protein HY025_02855 [Candidatus Daviesbacteria bacterium]|nr:hypothetical protein [Candidatus Daviesbacteria bacterium]